MTITTAVPPMPPEVRDWQKAELLKRRPLQAAVLSYLAQNRRSSVNGLACDLGRDGGSIQRCVKRLKRDGSVEDEWSYFSSSYTPRIRVHYFRTTEEAKRIAALLTSASEEIVEMPLGFRILQFFSSFEFFTVYTVSKLVGKPDGHVRRVMKTLLRHGLADFTLAAANGADYARIRCALWWITDEGRVLGRGSIEEYNHRVHRCKGGEYCKHRSA